jgi:hypothetical protein
MDRRVPGEDFEGDTVVWECTRCGFTVITRTDVSERPKCPQGNRPMERQRR